MPENMERIVAAMRNEDQDGLIQAINAARRAGYTTVEQFDRLLPSPQTRWVYNMMGKHGKTARYVVNRANDAWRCYDCELDEDGDPVLLSDTQPRVCSQCGIKTCPHCSEPTDPHEWDNVEECCVDCAEFWCHRCRFVVRRDDWNEFENMCRACSARDEEEEQ